MTFSVHGQAVSRGIAIGRAVLVASSRLDVAHYFVAPEQVDGELQRLRGARDLVIDELQRMQLTLQKTDAREAQQELNALLEVHLMLLADKQLHEGVACWVQERHYNAEWALTSHLEQIAKQFDEMEDPYLRERKSDLEQLTERLLRQLRGVASPVASQAPAASSQDAPLVLVAHDLSPADMLQFKQSVFAGFVTDVGGKTSHTAIVARSMDIPAVVGARAASHLVQQDDWVIIDGDAGLIIVNPSPAVQAEYEFRQREIELQRGRLSHIKNTPAVTLDGERIELLANIEQPADTVPALSVSAVGVALAKLPGKVGLGGPAFSSARTFSRSSLRMRSS